MVGGPFPPQDAQWRLLRHGLLSEDLVRHVVGNTVGILANAVVYGLFKNTPKKSRNSLKFKDLLALTARVTERALDQLAASVVSARRPLKVRKITKAVTRKLLKVFGSPEQLWSAALAPDQTALEDAVVSHLRTQLDSLRDPGPKACRMWRLFRRAAPNPGRPGPSGPPGPRPAARQRPPPEGRQ